MPCEIFPVLTHVSSFGSCAGNCSYARRVVWWFCFIFMKSPVEMLTSSQKTQVQAQSHTCVSTRMRSWHMVAVTFLIFIEEMLNFQLKMRISLSCVYIHSLTCSWTSQNSSPQPVSARKGLPKWAVWAANLREYCRAMPGNSGSCSELALHLLLGRLKK